MNFSFSKLSDNVKLFIVIGILIFILFITELVSFFGSMSRVREVETQEEIAEEVVESTMDVDAFENYSIILGSAASENEAESLIDSKYTLQTETVQNNVKSKSIIEDTDYYYGYSFTWTHVGSNGTSKDYVVNAIVYKDEVFDAQNFKFNTTDSEIIKKVLDSIVIINMQGDEEYTPITSTIKKGSEGIVYEVSYYYNQENYVSVIGNGIEMSTKVYIDANTDEVTFSDKNEIFSIN